MSEEMREERTEMMKRGERRDTVWDEDEENDDKGGDDVWRQCERFPRGVPPLPRRSLIMLGQYGCNLSRYRRRPLPMASRHNHC